MGQLDGEIDLIMSELYFNELSLCDSFTDKSLLDNFVKCKKELSKNGFNTCRMRHEDYVKLCDRMYANQNISPLYRNLFFSFFKSPYKSDKTEIVETKVNNVQYSFNGFTSPLGLSWAAVMDEISFSFLSHQMWDCPFVLLQSVDGSLIQVKHLSRAEHIAAWINLMTPVVLAETTIEPDDKIYHICGDHHGVHELKNFWKNRIKYCPYIEKLDHTLEYRPNCKQFATVAADNSIDLVLIWESAGYGMNVKTTARNKREAEKIAEYLNEKYGYP